MTDSFTEHARPWLRSLSGWVWIGFAAIAGFFLLMEHRAHVLGLLPFAIVLLCPILHGLHHRGHGSGREQGGHGPHDSSGGAGPARRTAPHVQDGGGSGQ